MYMNKLADAAAGEQNQVKGFWKSQANYSILPRKMVQLYIDGEEYNTLTEKSITVTWPDN